MAGTQPGFDAGRFRERITFVQRMAAPPDINDQVTFHFPAELVYVGNVDASGVPFDPNTTVQRVEPAPLKVPCAVEYVDAEAHPTPFGLISASKVRIILLDEHYEKVKNASYIVIAGDRYNFRRVEPPSGLFDVGIFTMTFVSENET